MFNLCLKEVLIRYSQSLKWLLSARFDDIDKPRPGEMLYKEHP